MDTANSLTGIAGATAATTDTDSNTNLYAAAATSLMIMANGSTAHTSDTMADPGLNITRAGDTGTDTSMISSLSDASSTETSSSIAERKMADSHSGIKHRMENRVHDYMFKYRKRMHYNQSIENREMKDEKGKIIRFWRGDQYTGQFEYGRQMSDFVEDIREYGVRSTKKDNSSAEVQEKVKSAVVELLGKDGKQENGEWALIEEPRVFGRRPVFMNAVGGDRPLDALTGPIPFSVYDNKMYHRVEMWSNGECAWIDSTDLQMIKQGDERRNTHTQKPDKGPVVQLQDTYKKHFTEILSFHEFQEGVKEYSGMDMAEHRVHTVNNTLLPVTLDTYNRHMFEGNHFDAFTAMFANWQAFSKEQDVFDLLSKKPSWSTQLEQWRDVPDDRDIKEVKKKKQSMTSKTQCFLMAQLFDHTETFEKLRGIKSGTIHELKGLPFKNLKELPRQSNTAALNDHASWMFLCISCHARKTRREADYCPVCRDLPLCSNCHQNKRKRKNGLCKPCYSSLHALVKYCKICGKNVARHAGTCDRCKNQSQKVPKIKCSKCRIAWFRFTDEDGIRYCNACFKGELCKECGEKTGKVGIRGKKGERICRSCSEGVCVTCNFRKGRHGKKGSMKCEECFNGRCVKCQLNVGKIGKKGEKVCRRCSRENEQKSETFE